MANEIQDTTFAKLIDAFHILHHKGVLDAYGHVSIRNPLDKETFFTSNKPANLITSPTDLREYRISDGTQLSNRRLDPSDRVSPFSEHYIHSSILSRYPKINSVVHSHSPVMIAFSIQRVNKCFAPLYAAMHLAGFLGTDGVRVFDVCSCCSCPRHSNSGSEKQNLLINTKQRGDELAMHCSNVPGDLTEPLYKTLLLRGHGFITCAGNLEDAVYQAVYAQENAQLQLDAERVGAVVEKLTASTDNGKHVPTYLSRTEAADCAATINEGAPKAWPSWRREVNGLAGEMRGYVNELMPPT